jgi:hypothetical protein
MVKHHKIFPAWVYWQVVGVVCVTFFRNYLEDKCIKNAVDVKTLNTLCCILRRCPNSLGDSSNDKWLFPRDVYTSWWIQLTRNNIYWLFLLRDWVYARYSEEVFVGAGYNIVPVTMNLLLINQYCLLYQWKDHSLHRRCKTLLWKLHHYL